MRRGIALAAVTLLLAAPAAAQTEEEPEDAPLAQEGPAEPAPADPAPSDPAPATDPSPASGSSTTSTGASGSATTTGTTTTGGTTTGTTTGATTTGGTTTGATTTGGTTTGGTTTGGTTTGGTSTGTAGSASTGTGSAAPGTGTMGAGAAAPSPYYRDRDRDDDDDDEEEDEGDPYDFLWIEAFGGWSFVDLRAIQETNFYPEFVRLQGDGPMGGAAVGFRIEFLSVGARVAIAHYGDEFDVGTATAEVTLAIPIPVFKPYLRVGFGLGWHGDSDYMAPDMSQTTVFGWAFTGAVGADIYFIDWFAVGAAITVDILNMSRQTIDDPMTGPGDVVFEDPGDAVGAQLSGRVAVSFHF